MTSKWEEFKKQSQQQQPTGKVQGRPLDVSYMCQFCPRMVTEATYYQSEGVVEYECAEGHISFIEKFYLS